LFRDRKIQFARPTNGRATSDGLDVVDVRGVEFIGPAALKIGPRHDSHRDSVVSAMWTTPDCTRYRARGHGITYKKLPACAGSHASVAKRVMLRPRRPPQSAPRPHLLPRNLSRPATYRS